MSLDELLGRSPHQTIFFGGTKFINLLYVLVVTIYKFHYCRQIHPSLVRCVENVDVAASGRPTTNFPTSSCTCK